MQSFNDSAFYFTQFYVGKIGLSLFHGFKIFLAAIIFFSARELLGKKLSSRVRKDLDEVAEKTGVTLKSCRRQFDNIKRIFKAVEEMKGCYVPNIIKTFHLPRKQAEQYATFVFIASFR